MSKTNYKKYRPLTPCPKCGKERHLSKKDVNKLCTSCVKIKHGMFGTRPYQIWHGIKDRCDNPNLKQYKWYGKRGITYDPKWKNFVGFWEDMEKEYKDTLTIDRVDGNGNYCKKNCKWVTNNENQSHKNNNIFIKHKGKRLHLAEWIRKLKLPHSAVRSRIARGYSPESAITHNYKLYIKN